MAVNTIRSLRARIIPEEVDEPYNCAICAEKCPEWLADTNRFRTWRVCKNCDCAVFMLQDCWRIPVDGMTADQVGRLIALFRLASGSKFKRQQVMRHLKIEMDSNGYPSTSTIRQDDVSTTSETDHK
jgi:hypothetical protein